MSDSSLIYCSCWDPRNLGPRKLVKTSPFSLPRRKPKGQVLFRKKTLQKEKKAPEDTIKISPGFTYSRSDEEISVILGDEMFERSKKSKEENMVKRVLPRTDVIADLENQITELTTVIEQMSRDHQSTQKLLTDEMEHRYNDLHKEYENSKRELKEAHDKELAALEEKYKTTMKTEKSVAQGKLESMVKEYKYLKNMFRMYQDSISDEMEEKWSRRKVEWEKNEKTEREKILLQQKYRLTKKFEVDVEEEKRRIEELHIQACEKFNEEKEAFIKQHEIDMLNLEELQKAKEAVEEELQAQSLILESLNTSLYQSQVDLQKEKNHAINLEQLLQRKLTEVEEKYKHTIQNLTEENLDLRHMLILKNEELLAERNKRNTREESFVYHDLLTENETVDPEQGS
ncbi:flagellum-associated coiled-coil domain-containing protein 1 isoform X2 [Trichosurus vulpecula]|uniref:flagellum-associated coiled-coil domain-containing protein 1 isoform X2 n=1 Tax=Trichosurus vulpecula TaxID=9337 RepID=UPI00186ACCF5|nr:flagellum-associated coiled-coil domain-containing protein 1 isoform X2 [Trichosurus vulpecula]